MRNKVWLIRVLFFLPLVLGILSVSAQEFQVNRLGAQQGLSNTNTNTAFLASDGNLFIGTSTGLDIYDGLHIFHVAEIPAVQVRKIFLFRDSILVIQSRAIHLIHAGNFRGRTWNIPDKEIMVIHDALPLNSIEIICAGEPGLMLLNMDNFQTVDLVGEKMDRKNDWFVAYGNNLYLDEVNQKVYIGFRHSTAIYAMDEKRLYTWEDAPSYGGILNDSNRLNGFYAWQDGFLYRGNSGLVYRYHTKKKTTEVFLNKATQGLATTGNIVFYKFRNYLYKLESEQLDSFPIQSSLRIRDLIALSKNQLLIASDQGVEIWQSGVKPIQIQDLPNDVQLHNPDRQQGIKLDDAYFFSSRAGIYKYDAAKSEFELYSAREFGVEQIYGFTRFRSDTLLVYGVGGYCGFSLKDQRYFPLRLFSDSAEQVLKQVRVNIMDFDSVTNFMLVGLFHYPVFTKNLLSGEEAYFNGNDRGWFRTVRSICQLGPYEYLLGANGTDGVMRMNFQSGNGHYYPAEDFYKAGLSHLVVQSIHPYQGRFLVATTSGIVALDTATGTMEKMDMEESVFNEHISNSAMIDGAYYFTTNNGFFRILDHSIVQINAFGAAKRPGIPFFANDGLSVLTESQKFAYSFSMDAKASLPRLSFIKYDNQLISLGENDQYVLPYLQSGVQFYFGRSVFEQDDLPYLIYYRIDPKKSFELVNDNRLVFENLPYGKYQIEYYAVQGWQKTDSRYFQLKVTRPWFAQWWFYGLLILLAVSGIAVFIKWRINQASEQKRKELQVILESIESERARISQEFHDAIGPSLSTIKLMGESIKRLKTDISLPPIGEVIDETIADFRLILQELSPDIIRTEGLCIALDRLVQMQAKNHPSIHIKLSCGLGKERFAEHIENNLYRISQEALNNSLKYAQASHIHIQLLKNEKELTLRIEDDGEGFDLQEQKGYGLQNMRSRAEVLKGKFALHTTKKHGTCVEVFVALGE